jgi:peptidoglycan hydrolase CwlO-like protein
MMKKVNLLFTAVFVCLLTACNNAPKETPAAEILSAEDSTAFEVKVSAEELEQQAQDLNNEVDSLVNSLNQ